MALSFIPTALLSVVVLYLLKQLTSRSQRSPLPPGPKPKPLIGNLLDLPKDGEFEWIHWGKHHELYGPISSVSIFGMHMIILNDPECASELLDKKSSIYSNRFSSVFGGEMCGWQNSLAMSHNGERFRRIRKYMHQIIGTRDSLRQFHGLVETEIRRMLYRIMKEPQDMYEHLRRATGAIILLISHGYTIDQNATDPLVRLADVTISEASEAFKPGNWMVDIMPFLRYLPDGFPGTGFKEVAKRYLANVQSLIEMPHAFVKMQMARGTAKPSLTQNLLEKPCTPEEEDMIKWAAAGIYGGGNDTTVSTTYSFILAMIQNPEVQQKAQEELDRVVGRDRLPTYEDRPNLPYINLLVKEALRWNPVLAMGVPHVTAQDDVYRGYLIPKGSVVMANLKRFTRDPRVYHNPDDFIPERFIGVDGHPAEPETDLMFGYGRRICPGKEMADLNLFISFSHILHVFRIEKAKDEFGKEIEVSNEWTPGLISRPKEYKYSISPRSASAAALIKHIDDEPMPKSDAEVLPTLSW